MTGATKSVWTSPHAGSLVTVGNTCFRWLASPIIIEAFVAGPGALKDDRDHCRVRWLPSSDVGRSRGRVLVPPLDDALVVALFLQPSSPSPGY